MLKDTELQPNWKKKYSTRFQKQKTPPTSTVSFKMAGSRPVSLLAHPVHHENPSTGHYQDGQAATTKKRSPVQSVLYSTFMPISCGAADHREAQIHPLILFSAT